MSQQAVEARLARTFARDLAGSGALLGLAARQVRRSSFPAHPRTPVAVTHAQ